MSAVTHLRLFSPDVLAEARPSSLLGERSLRSCYEALVLPELVGRRKATIDEYELHIRRWEEWQVVANDMRIEYPHVISDIDKSALLAWRNWLAQQKNRYGKPLTGCTVNKHLATVKTILRAATDEGWLERVPRVKRLPQRAAAEKRIFTYDQLSALYDACSVATWPARLAFPAPLYWRAAIVWWLNYGFRTQELTRYERDHEALPWGNVFWKEPSPAPNSAVKCSHGWFRYVPQKQKRSKPDWLVLPMNEVTRAHLAAIKPEDARPEDLCFPWPLTSRDHGDTWEAICDAAGIVGMNICHLRKSCVTWHNNVAYPYPIAQFITGHAAERGQTQLALPISGVMMRHYDNNEQVLVDHIQNFPQPDAFVRGAKLLMQ